MLRTEEKTEWCKDDIKSAVKEKSVMASFPTDQKRDTRLYSDTKRAKVLVREVKDRAWV